MESKWGAASVELVGEGAVVTLGEAAALSFEARVYSASGFARGILDRAASQGWPTAISIVVTIGPL